MDIMRIAGQNYPGFRMGPKPSDWCPYKRMRSKFEIQRNRGEGHVKMRADIGVM